MQALKPMKRFWFVVCIVVLLLTGSNPTMAQELAVRWSAYLFNGSTGILIRVFQDGAQSIYSLGQPENTYASGYDLAFTGSGDQVGFCAVKYPDNGGQGKATLYVRDIEPQTTSLQLDLGGAIGCRTGHHAFNADGTQMMVARVNYYPGDPTADTTKPSWQLSVVDSKSGAVLQEVNAQTPAALNAGIPADLPLLPYVQYFANNDIIFVAVPYGIGGGGEFPAYIWHVDSGSISTIEHWGNIGVDALNATGELIWLTADPNRTAAEPGSPGPINNELKLADKSGQEHAIYYTPDWVLTDAKFINGGQQIAIQEVSPFDQNHPDRPQVNKWVALDRAGSVSDLQTINTYGTLVAAPQGYAILDAQYMGDNQTQPRYSLDWHSNGGTVTLWSLDAPDMSNTWEIAWSAYTQSVPGLPEFPTFAGMQ
jgi:hypothetical protein